MPDYNTRADVMTLAEAAEYIRVSAKTLREMARDSRIPGKKVGREWRFLRAALNEWLSGLPTASDKNVPLNNNETQEAPVVADPVVQYQIPFAGFRDTAFRDNYQRALHRWVPWIAGFSAVFVDGVLERLDYSNPAEVTVMDPFAGVGTTLIEAMKNGHNTVGFEINPYAALACKAKISAHFYEVEILEDRTHKLGRFITKQTARKSTRPKSIRPPGFVSRVPFFSPAIERQVLFTLDFILKERNPWVRDLMRIALGSVMVGFSNYSYEPSLGTRAAAGKANVEHADVAAVLVKKLEEMAEDITYFRNVVRHWTPQPQVSVHETSYLNNGNKIPAHSIDALITSPPYLNNYHYIRNTRPQMFWLNMVQAPADLKAMERSSFGQFWQTVRSGPVVSVETQNTEVRHLLDILRERNKAKGVYGGNGWANYAATYFNDCTRFCRVTRKLMKPGGIVVIVIGNNILQGIEFPTDRLLAEIAAENGLELVEMHKVRSKRTGTSIVNSSVRAGTVKQRVHLYEMAVELRVPQANATRNRICVHHKEVDD